MVKLQAMQSNPMSWTAMFNLLVWRVPHRTLHPTLKYASCQVFIRLTHCLCWTLQMLQISDMICFALWSLPFRNHHTHNMQSSYFGDYIPIKSFPNFYLFFNIFGEETNKISQFTFGVAIIAFRISIIIKIIKFRNPKSQQRLYSH